MILNRARQNFRRRRRPAIHQNHQRIIPAAISMLRHVPLLRRRAPMMRDDQLSLLQKLIRDAHALAQQSTRILPQVQHQSLQIAHLIERFGDLVLGCLLESRNVHVPNPGLDHEMQIHAIARNLVANHAELQRMIRPLAQHRDPHRRALRPFQQVGHIRRAHVVRGFAVDRGDDVARTNARPVRRRSRERRDHDDLIVTRAHRHAYAVIFPALLFAQLRIRFRIEKIRVRIELVQHARNRPVIDRLVRIHRIGVVLLDRLVNLSELFEAVSHIRVGARRGRRADPLREQHAEQAKQCEDKNYQEE